MATFTRMPRTQLLVLFSLIIIVAALFANVVGIGDEVDEEGSVGGWIGLSAFGIAVTALLLLVAVPRIPREHRKNAVLGFGIAAIVFCVVFWSALPFAFAAAALYAAGPGEEQIPEEGEAPATAGVLLALLAVVVAFVLCVIG
jgi:hypothetical protein